MVKCSFCGDELKVGFGKLFAKKDGTVFYFCSSKCEKNLIGLKRKPVNTKWTAEHNKIKQATKASEKK